MLVSALNWHHIKIRFSNFLNYYSTTTHSKLKSISLTIQNCVHHSVVMFTSKKCLTVRRMAHYKGLPLWLPFARRDLQERIPRFQSWLWLKYGVNDYMLDWCSFCLSNRNISTQNTTNNVNFRINCHNIIYSKCDRILVHCYLNR